MLCLIKKFCLDVRTVSCFIPFRILFCNLSNIDRNTQFCPNHYVPLFNRKQNKRGRKRINSVSENKHPIPTIKKPKLSSLKQTKIKGFGGVLTNPTIYNSMNRTCSEINLDTSSQIVTSSMSPSSSLQVTSITSVSSSSIFNISPIKSTTSSFIASDSDQSMSNSSIYTTSPIKSTTSSPTVTSLSSISSNKSISNPLVYVGSLNTPLMSTSFSQTDVSSSNAISKSTPAISTFFERQEKRKVKPKLTHSDTPNILISAKKYDIGTYFPKVKDLS